jgi:hypothetical protein
MNAKGLDEVLSEAGYMSNVLYNYKQCAGKSVSVMDAEVMKERQTRFDKAMTKFNQNINK